MRAREAVPNYAPRLMCRNKTFKSQLRPAKSRVIDYPYVTSYRRNCVPGRSRREQSPTLGTKGGTGIKIRKKNERDTKREWVTKRKKKRKKRKKEKMVKWLVDHSRRTRERDKERESCIEAGAFTCEFLISKFTARSSPRYLSSWQAEETGIRNSCSTQREKERQVYG